MPISIETLTPLTSEPVTLTEMKRWLRVDWTDDDLDIADLISRAREWVEAKCNRSLLTRTLRLTSELPISEAATGVVGGYVLPLPRLAVELPFPPMIDVTLAEIEADIEVWETMQLDEEYVIEPNVTRPKIWLHGTALAHWVPSWDWISRPLPRIRVTYDAGYGSAATAVPFGLRHSIKLAVAHLYENREAAGALPDSILPDEHIGWSL